MSRSPRRGDSSGPALFPFLAVFLCTIGALILILVLTVSVRTPLPNETQKWR